MLIHYLRHEDIDIQKWDAAVDKAANGQIYAYSWYLDCLADNWDALISEDYSYIMPLPFNQKWLGVQQIYQPTFMQQLGVFGIQNPSLAIVTSFLNKIPKHFRYIYLQLNEKNQIPQNSGFNTRMRTNMLLDLAEDYEKLHQNFRKSLRKRIHKAKDVLHFRKNKVTAEQLVGIYKQNLNHKIGLADSVYKSMQNLIEQAQIKGKGNIYSAHFADESFATGLFLGESHNRLIQLFGPSTSKGKKVSASHFLLNEIIKVNAGQAKILDFEGSEIPSIAEYFRGYNPTIVKYPLIIKDDFPLWIKTAQKLRGFLKK